MTSETLSYTAWAVGAVAAGYLLLRAFWASVRVYRLHKAGPRPLLATHHRLWRDPGAVEALDLAIGPGGRDFIPVPPYRFLEEHSSGSQPCVSVTDGRGRRWRVKWGQEVRCETFAVRLAWACGYFAEITHFIPSGAIESAGPLARAAACVEEGGAFVDARFELDDPAVEKFFEEHSWSWTDNPFVGTRELAGLRVLMMLLSNWDNKDQRDVARGSNTAIYVARASRWRREAQYLVMDWGGSMGRWGRAVVTRGRWDPDGFAAQTPQFVTGVTADGLVQFGYTGQRTGDARSNIRVADVAWLCRYLGRITDAQLRAALAASGATDAEAASFTASLRTRMDQLVSAAASRAPSTSIRGAAPLGLPHTLSRAPLRRRAPFAWLARAARSLSRSGAHYRSASRLR